MKRFKVLACKIMQRELSWAFLRCPNALDITFVRQDLHMVPKNLTKVLQEEIDRIEAGEDLHTNVAGGEIDAILIGYGLCSNALVGLKSAKYPLVIPKAHDCTTLFMGSKEKYQDYFMKVKGTYFASNAWMELGIDLGEASLVKKREEFMEQFEDEDTVEYLMEMERSMLDHYKAITYITWPGMNNANGISKAKTIACENGWEYLEYEGSDTLLQKFVNGEWDEEDFLVLNPGETLEPSYDEDVICKA